jgi:hypothetical protein
MAASNDWPTKKELLKLSRRGMVAYAVRAARRVQPLFQADEERGITEEHVAAVDNAMRLAERFVSVAHPAVGDPELFDAANAATHAAANANAAYSAGYTATAAAATATAYDGTADAAYRAAYAADAAADADAGYAADADAAYAAAYAVYAIRTAIRRDYEFLLKLHHRRAPELGETIDLLQLGPLWPDGKPDWYRQAVQ